MSKMVRPEMSVVRFKEADVIVASGAVTAMQWTGFGDGVKANGVITYKGTGYTIDSIANVNNVITAMGDMGVTEGTKVTTQTTVSDPSSLQYTLRWVLEKEVNEGVSPAWGGDFAYNATGNYFYKKQ